MARRLERLKERQRECDLLAGAQRLADEFGMEPDVALHELREMAARIERWGLDAALRMEAQRLGLADKEIKAEYDRLAEEMAAAAEQHDGGGTDSEQA